MGERIRARFRPRIYSNNSDRVEEVNGDVAEHDHGMEVVIKGVILQND